MKKVTLILLILLIGAAGIFAQTPQAFKYQAVARDTTGAVIENQNISVKISILSGNPEGTVEYSELHLVSTNQFGLFALEIGNSTDVLFGNFADINWGANTYYVKVEADMNAGSNFQFLGTSQLLSVPYALHTVSLTLTDENGNNYIISVDTTGNLITTLIEDWTCGEPITDSRDGQTYNTVQIGDQCWMAENMNIGTMINGSNDQIDNGVIEKYCYDNVPANCDTYGGLYQWNELMQYETTQGIQGICPTGWHIATDEELKTLEGTVDSQYGVGDPVWDETGNRGLDAGGNLKETGTTLWEPPNTGATNSSGFTALPSGYRLPG